MSEIDSLELKISAEAKEASDSLDKLIGKLKEVTSILGSAGKDISNSIGASMKNVAPSMEQSFAKAERVAKTTAKKIGRSFDDIASGVRHIGVDYRIEGASEESLKKHINKLTNEQSNALIRLQREETHDNTASEAYRRAVEDFTILGNKLDGLREQMNEIRFPEQPIDAIDKLAQKASDANHKIQEVTEESIQFGREVMSSGYDKSAMEAVFGKDIANNVRNYADAVNQYGKDLHNTLMQTENEAKKVALQFPPITANLDKVNIKAMSLRDMFKQLKVNNTDAGLEKIDQQIRALQTRYVDMIEKIRYATKLNANHRNTLTFFNENKSLDRIRNDYARLIQMEEALSRAAGQNRVASSFDKMASAGKRATSAIGKLASKMAQFVKSASKTHSVSKSLDGIANKLTHSLTRVGNMLKLMVTRMALRKVIENVGTGFKGLALYSDEFNRSISMLIGSLKTLGYSISAAVGPMVNALAPAIQKIIQMCTLAVNYINQLISALSGKNTWIKAKDQVVDYAKSVKGAGKAAKGALLAIDEINNITTNNGGGAGDSEINPGDMFETVEIEDKIKDLSEKIKEMWESGDFTDLGAMIGEGLKEKLDAIPWDKIKAGAEKAGKAVGTLVTGFVKVEGLGKTFGRTAAEGINTLTAAVKGFVDNTDFRSIGDFLGDTINGFTDNLNVADIGHNIGEILKGAFDIAIGIVETTDWKNLAKKIAEIIKNVDWSGITNKLFEGLGALLGGLSAFLWGLIESAWDDVVAWWKETAGEDGKMTIGELLNGILQALANIAVWIQTNIVDPFIKGFEKGFGIGGSNGSSEMSDEGKAIVHGLTTGIVEFLPEIKKVLDNIKDIFAKTWSNVKDKTFEIWNAIKDSMKAPINGIIGFVNGMIQAITNGLNAVIDKLNSLSFDIPSWVPEWGGKHFGMSIPKLTAPTIPTLAAGGFVDSFSLFAAGENGIPEILGTVNGQNAVAGGAEITGIRDAIVSTASEEVQLLRQQNALLQGILEKEYGISKSDIGKAARDYGKDYYNRTGNNAYVF